MYDSASKYGVGFGSLMLVVRTDDLSFLAGYSFMGWCLYVLLHLNHGCNESIYMRGHD